MDVVLDTNVWIDAACGFDQAPTLGGKLPQEATAEFKMLWALAHGVIAGVRLHGGEHLWRNIFRVLHDKWGWPEDQAAAWVGECRRLVVFTGGDPDVAASMDALRPSTVTAAQVRFGVEDAEDLTVVVLARRAHARLVVSNDGGMCGLDTGDVRGATPGRFLQVAIALQEEAAASAAV